MDTLQAAILNVKINYYDDDIKNRQEAANKYTIVENHVQTPVINQNKKSVWAQYSIQIKQRFNTKKLIAKNILQHHYPKPLHLQECFKYLDYKKVTSLYQKISNSIISLPMNPYIAMMK